MRLVALVLLACACGGGQKQNEDLINNIRAYQEGLRWRRYEQAADYVAPDERSQFLDRRDEIDKDLRIDDYEVVRVTLAEGHEEALVQIRFTWHLDNVGTVHETVVEEKWKKEKPVWRIVDTKHKRGEEMPK
jgi:hypothetical protein